MCINFVPHALPQIVFNRIKPENYNLVATIADTQASIYDNANCGEHLDIMLHFVNVPLPGALKRDVRGLI